MTTNDPKTPESRQQLLNLLSAWCDETISDDEIRELNDLLRGDDGAQRIYACFMAVHNTLENLGPADASARLIPFPSPAQTKPARRPVWRVALEIAAVFVALGLAGWMIAGKRDSGDDPGMMTSIDITQIQSQPVETIAPGKAETGFAILTHTLAAEWADGARPLSSGAILGQGRVQLASGLAHLQFYNGVKVVLQGPAEFEILSMDESFCWQGRIHTTVPPHAQGFLVYTPTGELIDHGTKYGLFVGPDGSSEVHVFEGEVEFRDPHQETVAQLTPGHAARIDEFGRRIPLLADDEMFVTDEEVREWHAIEMERQFATWYQKSQHWRTDARLLTYYDFDAQDYLTGTIPALSSDPYTDGQEGIVIGTRLAQGRWPSKTGLEFMRSSDRVRVRIPGYHDALTMAAWVRIDRLEPRPHGLLLSDGFDHGAVHWQLDGQHGRLTLETRLNDNEIAAYDSPDGLIDEQLLGQWVHVACVYDRLRGYVAHYLNGSEVSREPITVDVRLRAGVAEIGNWGLPLTGDKHPIRNFIGVIDEFAVFGGVLQPEEIAELANDGESS